jgi:hypothetical protein
MMTIFDDLIEEYPLDEVLTNNIMTFSKEERFFKVYAIKGFL